MAPAVDTGELAVARVSSAMTVFQILLLLGRMLPDPIEAKAIKDKLSA